LKLLKHRGPYISFVPYTYIMMSLLFQSMNHKEACLLKKKEWILIKKKMIEPTLNTPNYRRNYGCGRLQFGDRSMKGKTSKWTGWML